MNKRGPRSRRRGGAVYDQLDFSQVGEDRVYITGVGKEPETYVLERQADSNTTDSLASWIYNGEKVEGIEFFNSDGLRLPTVVGRVGMTLHTVATEVIRGQEMRVTRTRGQIGQIAIRYGRDGDERN